MPPLICLPCYLDVGDRALKAMRGNESVPQRGGIVRDGPVAGSQACGSKDLR